MELKDITLGELAQLREILNKNEGDKMDKNEPTTQPLINNNIDGEVHPYLGKRCVIRTYSAGVHIGTITYIKENNSMELILKDALRLWSWEKGGLSLSAVATNGIKGGRLNKTPEVYLTNAIEMIPCTDKAWESYLKFVEDDEQ